MTAHDKCGECGAAVPAGANFCPQCGAAQTRLCQACAAPLADGARFCHVCGAAAGAGSAEREREKGPAPADVRAGGREAEVEGARGGQAEVEGAIGSVRDADPPATATVDADAERRLVTILFADLTGSTQAGAAVDPEDLSAVVNGAFDVMTKAVADAGGHIARLMGDGMLAFFGAPVSHEDDPLRAVRAAIAIRDGIAGYAARLPGEWPNGLDVRVGVDAGLVVVGRVGSDLFSEYTTLGDPANTAARLQAAASPGEILLSETAARLVRDAVALEDAGARTMKGKSDPVPTYRVTGDSPELGASVRGLAGVSTPIVDREGELARVLAAFRDVVDSGTSSAITIVGPAGVGKSRLLEEALESVGDEVILVLRARALPQEAGSALCLPRDLVRRRMAEHAGAASGTTAAALETVVAADMVRSPGAPAGRVAGDLARLLAPGAEDPSAARELSERALGALATWMRAMALGGPVLVVFEDLHWADDASLDAVRSLWAALSGSAVLFLGTARPDLFDRRPHWGEGELLHLRLDLAPLTGRGTRELVRALLDSGTEPPAEAVSFVAERSEGNPYFVEELVRMLLVRGALARSGDEWSFDPAPLAHSPVPTTLQGILQAHLDALEAAEKNSLQRASVIGRVFWDGSVRALGVEDPGVLDRVRGRGLIFARERSTFAGTREFMFRHALLSDAAYETLLKRARPRLHGMAADWLLGNCGERYGEFAARIGDHCAAAGRGQDAARHYSAAGEAALAAYANQGARAQFTLALEHLADDRAAERMAALRGRELALDAIGDREAQAADLEAMAQLAAQMSGPERSYVAFRKSWLFDRTGDVSGAEAQARVALTEAGSDEASRGNALMALGNALLVQGQPGEARTHYQEALEVFDGLGDRRRRAMAAMSKASCDEELGDAAAARAGYEEALALFEELDDLRRQGVTRTNLAVLLATSGDLEGAGHAFRAALDLYQQAGDRGGQARALANLGRVAREQGDWDEALSKLALARDLTEGVGDRREWLGISEDLSEVCAHLGRKADAARYGKEAASLRTALEVGVA